MLLGTFLFAASVAHADEEPASPPPSEPPAPAAPAAGTVRVHIDAPEGIPLERRSAANAPWEHACNAPCDEPQPVSYEYRFGATTTSPESQPFALDARKGDALTIKAEPADSKKKKYAPYVLIGSAVVAVTGIVIIAAGVRPSETFGSDGATHHSNINLITAGTLLLAAGATGGIVGASWYLKNNATQAGGDVQRIPEPSKAGATPAPRGAAFMLPVWSGTF
jgi:hypothetical protein